MKRESKRETMKNISKWIKNSNIIAISKHKKFTLKLNPRTRKMEVLSRRHFSFVVLSPQLQSCMHSCCSRSPNSPHWSHRLAFSPPPKLSLSLELTIIAVICKLRCCGVVFSASTVPNRFLRWVKNEEQNAYFVEQKCPVKFIWKCLIG